MEQVMMQSNISQADRIAELVSYVFHPLVVVVPTLVIAMVRLGSTIWEALFWTVLSIAIVNLPMALLLFWGWLGKYSDASVSIREHQHRGGGTCQ
jgi:hypothetical protein